MQFLKYFPFSFSVVSRAVLNLIKSLVDSQNHLWCLITLTLFSKSQLKVLSYFNFKQLHTRKEQHKDERKVQKPTSYILSRYLNHEIFSKCISSSIKNLTLVFFSSICKTCESNVDSPVPHDSELKCLFQIGANVDCYIFLEPF